MFNDGIIDTLSRMYHNEGHDESLIEIIDMLLISTISDKHLDDMIHSSDLQDLLLMMTDAASDVLN